MEQSPSYSASQEIPNHLWNPKFQYRFQNSSAPVSILRHMNPVHGFPTFNWLISIQLRCHTVGSTFH